MSAYGFPWSVLVINSSLRTLLPHLICLPKRELRSNLLIKTYSLNQWMKGNMWNFKEICHCVASFNGKFKSVLFISTINWTTWFFTREFSRHSMSKSLSWAVLRHWCKRKYLPKGTFVSPIQRGQIIASVIPVDISGQVQRGMFSGWPCDSRHTTPSCLGCRTIVGVNESGAVQLFLR